MQPPMTLAQDDEVAVDIERKAATDHVLHQPGLPVIG